MKENCGASSEQNYTETFPFLYLNSDNFLMHFSSSCNIYKLWSNTSVNWDPIPFDFMDQGVFMQPALAC